MTSTYYDQLDALKKRRCERCQGSGTVDDAEPGDIMFNTATCSKCAGTGFNDYVSQQLKGKDKVVEGSPTHAELSSEFPSIPEFYHKYFSGDYYNCAYSAYYDHQGKLIKTVSHPGRFG